MSVIHGLHRPSEIVRPDARSALTRLAPLAFAFGLLAIHTLTPAVSAASNTSGDSFRDDFGVAAGNDKAARSKNIALGDLDGDGDPDLVVTRWDTDEVVVVFNTGGGRFATAASYPVIQPVSVDLGDVDGDGDLDLVAASLSRKVSVFLNDGKGGFDRRTDIEQPASPGTEDSMIPLAGGAASLADLDGDGDLDLFTIGDFTLAMALPNDGTGNFSLPAEVELHEMDDVVTGVTLGDLNGDGHPDAVLPHGSVSVLLNSGSGRFDYPIQYPVRRGSHAEAVALGDLDGDGDLDLIVQADFIELGLNDGSGDFGQLIEVASVGAPFDLAVGDLDGDGDPDLAILTDFSDVVRVLLNEGNGSFVATADYTLSDYGAYLEFADLNGDADLDVVAVSRDSATLWVLENQGGGRLVLRDEGMTL